MPEELHNTLKKTVLPPSNTPTPHPILPREAPGEEPEPVILEEHVVAKKARPKAAPVGNTPEVPSTQTPSIKQYHNPLSALTSLIKRAPSPGTREVQMPTLGVNANPANTPEAEVSYEPHSLGVSVPPITPESGVLEKSTILIETPIETGEVPARPTPNVAQEPQTTDHSTPEDTGTPLGPITNVMPQSKETKSAHLSSILGSVKIPERKEFRAKADMPTYENKMAPMPSSASEAAPLEAPPQIKKEFDIPSVHTLRDDLDQLVDGQKLSMVKAAALEQDKRTKGEAAEKVTRPKRGTGRLLKTVLLSLFLVLLGGAALATIAIVAGQRQGSPAASPTLSSIMFSEKTLSFPIDNLTALDVKKQLSLARSQVPLSLGAVARIVPTERRPGPDGASVETPLTTDEFFTAIGAHLPDGFARALSNEFFFGVHALDQNVPVLVLPVAVYERAFAGALAWEKTMNEDLAPVFTSIPAQTITQDGTVVSRKFEDVIIQNYDVRIVRDQNGTVRLLYAFPTRDILIIAESPNSFTETLARLRAERRL